MIEEGVGEGRLQINIKIKIGKKKLANTNWILH